MKITKLYQPNCVPCQNVSKFLDENSVVYENVDVTKNPDLAIKFDIMTVPVTILLDDDGNEVKRSVGYKPDELKEIISQL